MDARLLLLCLFSFAQNAVSMNRTILNCTTK